MSSIPANEHIEIGAIQSHGIATYPAGATFGPRQMQDWEFVWLLEGDAEYSWNDQTVPAPHDSVVLCRPHATDSFRWDTQKRTRHAFFHFAIHSLPTSWPQSDSWPLVCQTQADDLLQPLFRHVLRALKNRGEHTDSPEIKLAIAHMLTVFVRGENSGESSGEFTRERWPDTVERAWNYLHHRLETAPDADIKLAELARASHTTPEHLCRVFKAATGWTPMQATRLARLDRAATMLARSNYSVGEIARLCGFASAFHFSRRFRDAFGQSPRELRHNLNRGITPPTPRLLRLS